MGTIKTAMAVVVLGIFAIPLVALVYVGAVMSWCCYQARLHLSYGGDADRMDRDEWRGR